MNVNMHQNLVFLGDDNFTRTFEELKSFFEFDYKVQNIKDFKEVSSNSIYILLLETLKKIKVVNDNNIIVLKISDDKNIKYANINLPCDIFEFQKLILKNLIAKKFVANTEIKVKNYLLDVNSRILIRNKMQLQLTEKETKLIELLNEKKVPLNKEQLINLIWNYSSKSETHTLETHIYRLRKKISDKFNDDNFIRIRDKGYYI